MLRHDQEQLLFLLVSGSSHKIEQYLLHVVSITDLINLIEQL